MQRVRTLAIVAAAFALLPRVAPAQTSDPSDALFNDTVLHEIRLSINDRDLQLLRANWQQDTKYPADFRWKDQTVRNVSVHSRGAGSRRPDKLSFHVTFDHYTTG